ncbi:MAG: prevent-host-death protein [bacterium]|nr:prevent-host-death protein [Candidatus Microgenomates bacterium CPR3]MCQ3944484.1 prevent-host-death protein [bacterium]RIK51179.1 MAG: prevent-host-death protein [Candidatus Microgenomates bacterium]
MSDNTISISELKINPAAAIAQATDYPLQVLSKGKGKAYLIGKQLFEKLIERLEDYDDAALVKSIKPEEYKNARNFEEVARDLGL